MLRLSTTAAKRSLSTGASHASWLSSELAGIHEAGTWKEERVITTPQAAMVKTTTSSTPVMNFCANNYLGLSSDPRINGAAKDAIDSHGFGLSSVRFICGTQDIHKQLEAAIADFHGTEDCILYPSCFDANAGLFECILTKDDAVISDSLNHASIIDGIRLCKAQRHRYANRDMKDLERILAEECSDARTKLIATDGVFSMDGSVAPLKDIEALANKYDALVFVDECHATGFFGKTGRGAPEHCDAHVDIINSTLGKALGGATGGYTAASKDVVALLRQRSRPYLFSNSLAPAVAGASLEVFRLLSEDSSLVATVRENTVLFRTRMEEAGFTLSGDPEHPICPVMLGDARLASELSDALLEEGIYVIGFSFPVVPKGQARIRVQISGAHTTSDVNACVDAFIKCGKKMDVIA